MLNKYYETTAQDIIEMELKEAKAEAAAFQRLVDKKKSEQDYF